MTASQGPDDVNAVISGFLRDLAFAQASPQKTFGYKRAAAAILALDAPLTDLVAADGTWPHISGVGPGSTRVINEILESGISPTVDRAVEASTRRADIERRRGLRQHVLSRAEALRILSDASVGGPSRDDYLGDLQMHSEWSDGSPTMGGIAEACLARGYRYAAVTDHSHGLQIAGGMSMADAAEQRREIERVNDAHGDRFRLLQGVEANIDAAGALDLSHDEAAAFELVLAAPHSRLRRMEDQTARMVAVVRHPHVRILAHPRGRIAGSRAGVVADWDMVFAEAAARGVAVEIDGDPSRQDLDHTLVGRAHAAGCVFALDSDAHTTTQLWYSDIALAHARLAAVPVDRIVNCWPLARLLAWIAEPSGEVSTA